MLNASQSVVMVTTITPPALGQSYESCSLSRCVQVHLQEHGHLGLVHGLDGGLQQLGGVLQVLAVPAAQTSDVVQLLLLLSTDPQRQLTFSFLQQCEQVIKRLAHL